MPLKLVRRHNSPNYYIRGSVKGMRIDESTGVDREKAAREILTLREAELIKESIHGPAAVRTFADAVSSYVMANGEVTHLSPLVHHFGSTKLARIGQEQIDAAARKLAHELNGELKDDQRSVMTAQTIEHYRQRIVEFERKKQLAGKR